MIRIEYHWMPECGIWFFMVINEATDDVLATGSEPKLEDAIRRARSAKGE